MNRFVGYAGQGAVYAAIALLIGFFANAPAYERVSPDNAVIKLSLVHGGKRGDCRERTPEELANLPPNMRKTVICPRGRSPVTVKLELSGELIYAATLPPTGFSRDGPSRVYERFEVPAGHHSIVVRLRDTARPTGFDYIGETEVMLDAGRNFAIDFDSFGGVFRFE
jgi:hypothetical protein